MASTDPLSKREQEVFELLMQGMSNQQIANSLGTTERPVEFHLNHIYTKLGVSSRTEAILQLGKTTVPSVEKPRISTVESNPETAYDVGSGAGTKPKRSLAPLNPLLLVLGIIFIMLFFQTREKGVWRFKREAEYPEDFTAG